MEEHPSRRAFLAGVASVGALLAAPRGVLARGDGAAARAGGGAGRGFPQAMPTRPVPGTGEPLPIVGLGSSKAVLEIPEEGVDPIRGVIRQLLERGGRVVDTSPRTEAIDERFGRLLQESEIADRLFVATKINTPDAETGVAQMRQNQRLFGRRTVDLVQIESLRGLEHHWPRLLEWKEAGEARYIGVTVSDDANHDRLEAFMRSERPDFVHVNYSVVERRAEERILPLAADRGMAVLVNRPFMNGSYFGRVGGRALPAWVADFDCHAWSQFTLKYILANPAVTCVLTETTDPEHMEENMGAAFGRVPSAAERMRMRSLADTL